MFHGISLIYFLSFSFPLKLLKMGLGFDLDAHLLKHTLFCLFLLCHLHFIFLIYNIYDYIYVYIYIYLYMHHISVDTHLAAFRPCSCAIFFSVTDL